MSEVDTTKVTITGLRYPREYKTVFAYGMTLDVPTKSKFLTIDLYGNLNAWTIKPIVDIPFYDWTVIPTNIYFRCILIGRVRYTGVWTDSLVELPNE